MCSGLSKSTISSFTKLHPWAEKCQHLDLGLTKTSKFPGPRVRIYLQGNPKIQVFDCCLTGQTFWTEPSAMKQPFSSILLQPCLRRALFNNGGFVKREACRQKQSLLPCILRGICWFAPVKQSGSAFADLDWFNPLRLTTGMMSPAMRRQFCCLVASMWFNVKTNFKPKTHNKEEKRAGFPDVVDLLGQDGRPCKSLVV